MCILPSSLGTTTIAVHHSVGTSTLDITPVLSILSSVLAEVEGYSSRYGNSKQFSIITQADCILAW